MEKIVEDNIEVEELEQGIVKVSVVDQFGEEHAVYLKKKLELPEKSKVVRGKPNFRFVNLKKFLITMGLAAVIGTAVYGGVKVVENVAETIEEYSEEKKANDNAVKNYELNSEIKDYHILDAFIRDVYDRICTNEDLNMVQQNLLTDLTPLIRDVDKYSQLSDEAFELGEYDKSKEYKKMSVDAIREATRVCGDKGYYFGAYQFKKYRTAVYHDGQVMYLEEDLPLDTELDTRFHYSIDGKIYIPTTSPNIEPMVKVK